MTEKKYIPFGSKEWLDRNIGGVSLAPVRGAKRWRRVIDNTEDPDMRALCRGDRCSMKCNNSCNFYRAKQEELEGLRQEDYAEYLSSCRIATKKLLRGATGERRKKLIENLSIINSELRKFIL